MQRKKQNLTHITSITETPEPVQKAYERLMRRYPGLKAEFDGYTEGKICDELYLRDGENRQHVLRAMHGRDQAYYRINDTRGRMLVGDERRRLLKKLEKP